MSRRRDGRDLPGVASGPEVLDPLSELARYHLAATPAPRPGLPAWAAFRAARRRDAQRRRVRAMLVAAGLAAAVVLAAQGLWVSHFQRGITYAVEGATGTGGYVSNVRGARAQLTFSDGTRVALEHGGRAWVVSTGAEGARIRLEDGRARFSVRHRRQTRWSVEAGPYVVLVTGTEFDVRWSATDEVFRLHLYDGVVTVQGPFTGGGVRLSPGQELEARPGDGALRIGRATDAAAPAPAGAARPAPAPASGPAAQATAEVALPASPPRPRPSREAVVAMMSPSRAGPRPQVEAPPPEERPPSTSPLPDIGADWAREVARGQFQIVLREAARLGPDHGVRALASDRLAALADAARYAGQPDVARRALLAQRARFGGLDAARDAAFLLGRLAEDATGAPREALGWYDRYLAEAPSGTYAAEALGRKLVILFNLGDADGARAAGAQYLERFPDGAYARRARLAGEQRP